MAEVGANFEKKWGTNKIKSVSIDPRNTHVHGKLAIQKFYFVPPPYQYVIDETGLPDAAAQSQRVFEQWINDRTLREM